MLRVMTAISFKINENTDNLRTTHDVFSAWGLRQGAGLQGL